jgi:Bacterial membrane protein YfhO
MLGGTNAHEDPTHSTGTPTPIDRRIVGLTAPRREHLWAGVLLGLFLVVFLWPALIDGRVLTADASLYSLAPWKALTPTDIGHFDNTILIDIPRAHFTWDLFDRRSILNGVFPAWNNEILTGFPYYTNSQSGLTSVFNIPLWILPFNYALGLVAWIKLFIAAFGSYLLARLLRLSFWPGMLAGVAYSLCAFNVVWLGHQTLVASSVWLPWMILLIESLLHRPRNRNIVLLALVSALVLDGGHPGTEVQVLGASALYALVRVLTLTDVPKRVWGKRLIAVGLSMILGALLMSFLIVPVLEAAPGTIGVASREGGGINIPWSALRTAVFPDWWGRPSEMNYGGPINYVERTLYVGTITLLLAAFALTGRGRWRHKLPFLVIAALGIMVPFSVPVVHTIVVTLPLLSSVQDARMTFWFQFGMALLAAFGLQALIDCDWRAPRRAWVVTGAGLLIAILAAVLVHPSLHDLRTTINHFRTGTEYHVESILALTTIGWWTIFTVGTMFVMWLGRKRLPMSALAGAIVLLAALDMFHFAHGFQPMGPASQVIPPTPPSTAFLEKRADLGRTVGINNALTNDYTMNYGLNDVRGYDPPEPTNRYFHLWQLANPLQRPNEDLDITKLTATGLQVMSALGARFILADPAEPPISLPGLSTIYKANDAVIYENSHAAPAAFVPSTIAIEPSEQATLLRISSRGYEPSEEALVESTAARIPVGRGTVTVQRDYDADVHMTASLSRGGLVVLNDAWAPGWSVRIDGHSARILRVNDVMRGVDVPAGNHLITWHYEVPGLKLGATVSAFALLLLLLLCISPSPALLLRRRRQAQPGPS